MRALAIFLTLFHAVYVAANTESVRFVFEQPTELPPIDAMEQLNDTSSGLFGAFRSNKVQDIAPSFSKSNEEFYTISGVPGRQYEVRVCWPASDPLQVQLVYLPAAAAVKLTVSPDYYSHLAELQRQPLPAKYDVVLNPVLFGALPSDIVSVIAQVVCAGLCAYFVSGRVLHVL